jgi:sugar lactone lactonase YvrE
MTLQVHATGLGFPEGPQALPDGSILFVDLLHQKVRRYADGEVAVVAVLDGSPNGMRSGPDGRLYIANNGGVAPDGRHGIRVMQPQVTGRFQRLGEGGAVEDVVTELPGRGPWRPNDLIFTAAGDIVFTDPQNWDEVRAWTPAGRIPGWGGGRLLLGSPATGKARLLTDLYGFPNGLAFHSDGSLLVGLSLLRRIVKLPWFGDRVGAPEIWCQFDDGTCPDGLLFHEGYLYVAGSAGDHVVIVDTAGRVVRKIATGAGSEPTNLCLQGNRLWITLGLAGQLVSFDL